MRRAVIDIGTNTVKLLVADVQDGRVQPVVAKDVTTRLGEGVGATKRLSSAAIARTIEAVGRFATEAGDLGAVDIVALTTSAAREAVNCNEFIDGVRGNCGLEVQAITGEREAELVFRGVCSDPAWSKQRILVLDVGGGSVEFIVGQAGKVERSLSMPLGAVRLTEQFGEAGFAKLAELLRGNFQVALRDYSADGWKMIGTGGAITMLAQIQQGKVDHVTITQDSLRTLVAGLNSMTLVERKKVPGLPPERADIIVAGGAVFLFAMEALQAAELTVSVRNLRYGALVGTAT